MEKIKDKRDPKNVMLPLDHPGRMGTTNESFSGKLRVELLNIQIFCNLKVAQIIIEQWG